MFKKAFAITLCVLQFVLDYGDDKIAVMLITYSSFCLLHAVQLKSDVIYIMHVRCMYKDIIILSISNIAS